MLFIYLLMSLAGAGSVRELCVGGAVEGSFVGKVNERTAFRANVICAGENKMVVSLGMTLDDQVPTVRGFTYVRVDGDRLVATEFSLDEEDRNDLLLGHRSGHLSVDLAALRAGRLEGRFMSGQMREPQTLRARREHAFPQVFAATPSREALDGTFKDAALTLRADVLLDQPVFALTNESGHVTHFNYSAPWTGDGSFRATSSVNQGHLTHIRGRVVPNVGVEFFVVDPKKGLRGPFLARRLRETS